LINLTEGNSSGLKKKVEEVEEVEEVEGGCL